MKIPTDGMYIDVAKLCGDTIDVEQLRAFSLVVMNADGNDVHTAKLADCVRVVGAVFPHDDSTHTSIVRANVSVMFAEVGTMIVEWVSRLRMAGHDEVETVWREMEEYARMMRGPQ